MASILIVEDRPIDRKLLATILRTRGHEIVEASDGKEALDALKQISPDLVVSDILMPRLDGYEFVRRMREIPELAATPVIFYTATYHEREARALAYRCGATDVLTKPSALAIEGCACLENRKMDSGSRDALELTRLRQAVDASGEVIFMTDRQGVFTFVNPQFEHLYGYSAREVVGRVTPRVLKDGAVPSEDYQKLWVQLLQGESVQRAFVNRTKDGRLVDVEATLSPIRDEAETIVGFLAIERDVTTRKRADDELRFQQAVLTTERELTLDGILVVDDRSRVLSFNARFAQMWGIPGGILGTRADAALLDAVRNKLPDPEKFMEGVRHLYDRHDDVSHDEVPLIDGRVFDRYSAPLRGADGQYLRTRLVTSAM